MVLWTEWGSCVFWTQLWGWSKFTRNSYHPRRRCICRWCGGVHEIRRDVVDLVPVQWRPHVGPLLGWNALTGDGEGGGREYDGGWEFGKWSLSSSLYLTHTRMHAHTPRVAVQLTLAQVHCGGVPGGGGVGRRLGGRGGAVIKGLWERGAPCTLLDAFHPHHPTYPHNPHGNKQIGLFSLRAGLGGSCNGIDRRCMCEFRQRERFCVCEYEIWECEHVFPGQLYMDARALVCECAPTASAVSS